MNHSKCVFKLSTEISRISVSSNYIIPFSLLNNKISIPILFFIYYIAQPNIKIPTITAATPKIKFVLTPVFPALIQNIPFIQITIPKNIAIIFSILLSPSFPSLNEFHEFLHLIERIIIAVYPFPMIDNSLFLISLQTV